MFKSLIWMNERRRNYNKTTQKALLPVSGAAHHLGRHTWVQRAHTLTLTWCMSHSYRALTHIWTLYFSPPAAPYLDQHRRESVSLREQKHKFKKKEAFKSCCFKTVAFLVFYFLVSLLAMPVCILLVVWNTYYLASLCRWWQTQFSKQIWEEAERWKPSGWRRKTPLWRSTWKIY